MDRGDDDRQPDLNFSNLFTADKTKKLDRFYKGEHLFFYLKNGLGFFEKVVVTRLVKLAPDTWWRCDGRASRRKHITSVFQSDFRFGKLQYEI